MDAMSLQRAGFAIALTALAAVQSAGAQTPAQMEYERQQREYWRAQEQQRQEQQRQQQLMNENAQRQQQESANAARRSQEQPGQNPNLGAGQGRPQQAQGNGQGDSARLDAARRSWLGKPALAPDKNPLLGRWKRTPNGSENSTDPFAGLLALAKGGLCELMFGGGVFEFRPASLVGMDGRTPEQELDQVEYRGDARQVVVIPKTTFKLMVFEFNGPDRINWQGQNCPMLRVKSDAAAAEAGTPARAALAAPATAAAPPSGNGDAALSLVAGLGSGTSFAPAAGNKFLLLRHSVDVALTGAGYRPPPGMPVFTGWALECQRPTPACKQGIAGIRADQVGVLQTDSQGRAQMPQLPAGAYYVFGSATQGQRSARWNLRVDLKQGSNSVTLDERNAWRVN
jgi:hypothetical protein